MQLIHRSAKLGRALESAGENQQISVDFFLIRRGVRFSVTARAKGDAVPDAIALLRPQNVMDVEKAWIGSSCATFGPFAFSSGPFQHCCPDPWIPLYVGPRRLYRRRTVAPDV